MQPDELLKLAKKEKLDQLESAWVAAVDEGPAVSDALLEVPGILVERGHGQLAESLMWYLVDSLAESGNPGGALEAARAGARLLPESGIVRELLVGLVGQAYAGRDDLDALMQVTLRAAGLRLDEALAALDKMLSLRPGAYVLDVQQGAAGRVVGFDVESGSVLVDLGDSEKAYGPGLVVRLEPLEEDDFRALRVFERDRLRALADEDPGQLVEMVLNSVDRRMELHRLRLHLEPVVGSWSKWWSAAREKLQRSSHIGLTPGRSPSLFVRSRPLSHGQRLLRRFESAADELAGLAVALQILKEVRAHDGVEREVLERVAGAVRRAASGSGHGSPALALAAAAVLDAFLRRCPDLIADELAPPANALEILSDGEAFVSAVTDRDVLLCVLEFVRQQWPHTWQDIFAGLMPLMGRQVCQETARVLRGAGAGQALAEAGREILARTDATSGSVAWLWRSVATDPPDELRDAAAPVGVLMRVLSMIASLVRDPDLDDQQRKEQIAELRTVLFMREGAPLREVLKDAQTQQVAALKGLAERNPGLTPRMQEDLANMLRAICPALFEHVVLPWEEQIVYTTEAGTAKRREELEHIVHVRLPEVMREIGQAASFGDVSDNAEYRAALEERGRLAQRAARMQEELSEARVITREMASADHVTVGSRVQARNAATGQIETYTFLGPWDAQPDQTIYAYNAPLGLAFMGKRVGDTVTFRGGTQDRQWEILATGPGL